MGLVSLGYGRRLAWWSATVTGEAEKRCRSIESISCPKIVYQTLVCPVLEAEYGVSVVVVDCSRSESLVRLTWGSETEWQSQCSAIGKHQRVQTGFDFMK